MFVGDKCGLSIVLLEWVILVAHITIVDELGFLKTHDK